ncbi:hypothetical protein [Mycolicibacterium sp. lyk4-40-TYG-92]|uniref:hypothetical protein n=1 Tax=Mycolicibacterium sp. lyk4-40-TYG-92 TaxID=3040295 RepID=UPI0025513F49|nr:hypothetical protein [Mycolicibacterium sp. lyk4-40-TYG-92]
MPVRSDEDGFIPGDRAPNAETPLTNALRGASSTQIGSLGEETAAILLESLYDAVIVTMGDAGMPRRGASQDLDLVVIIDGELIAYEVKTMYHSRKAFALDRAGNLATPRLRRGSGSGGFGQGSPTLRRRTPR